MTAQPKASPQDYMLNLRRVFQASREAVFRAFTDPDQVKSWYGPKGFSAAIDRFEAKPGGAYRLCMTSPDGKAHWLRGSFVAVEPHERLAFTWIWEQGDMADVETLVEVRFVAVGEATEVVLDHTRLPSEGARDAHGQGWASSFDCLDDFLNQRGR